MWATVTGFNGQAQVQVVAAATILLYVGSTQHETVGQATLQRFGETERFRILFEGTQDGSETNGVVLLPTDQDWEIVHSICLTRNGGGRRNFLVQLKFPLHEEQGAGLRMVQLLFPLISGNSRRAKLFHEGLIFADQCGKVFRLGA